MTLESGLGHRTVPLLLAESSFRGSAKNWSSLLQLSADMTLEVGTVKLDTFDINLNPLICIWRCRCRSRRS